MNSPQHNQSITVSRDCRANLIPSGEQITIQTGTQVYITQALGGSYTVYVNGNLARIDNMDCDALGLHPMTEQVLSSEGSPAGEVDENLVWEQLKTCYDPEIPINIVELGLIYDCTITPQEAGGGRVDVVMTLTAPGCGMGQFLVEDVRGKLSKVPNVTEVGVELVFDPPWNQSMMSEAAQLQTGLYY